MKLFFYLCLLYATTHLVASDVKLYKNFTFGLSHNEVQEMTKAYDCSNDFGKGALCQLNQSFLNHNYDVSYRFIENKLVDILLLSEFNYEVYYTTLQKIGKKFQLIGMLSEGNTFDFIVERKKYKDTEYFNEITKFERKGLSKNDLTYIFIDKENFNNFLNQAYNMQNLIQLSSENVREIDYKIFESESRVYSMIQFTVPKKSLSLLNKTTEDEDF